MHFIKRTYGLLIFSVAFLAIFSKWQGSIWFMGLKPLTTLLLLLLPLSSWASAPRTFRRGMVTGLFFCLVGDVFLLWDHFFLFGLGAFLVAHLLFAYTFSNTFGFSKSLGVLAGVLCVAVLVFVLLYPHLGTLQLPVLGYMLAIAFMVWQGVGAYFKHKNKPTALLAVGALCFMLSDSLLGYNKFVAPLPWESFWVLGSYWLALYGLAKATTFRLY